MAKKKFKTVRYNRGDLGETVRAAIRLQSDDPLYVFATHGGYVINRNPPPFNNQTYVVIHPDGEAKLVEYKPGR